MTFIKNKAEEAKKAPQVHLDPIPRSSAPAFSDVGQAIEADQRYFAEHPDQDEYIRGFCPGEFGATELPDIPDGFRYATVVTVIHRTDGVVDGRHRRMIAVCDDLDAEASEPSPASPAPPTQRWGASAKRSSNERVALVLLLLLSGLSLCEVPPKEMWHEG